MRNVSLDRCADPSDRRRQPQNPLQLERLKTNYRRSEHVTDVRTDDSTDRNTWQKQQRPPVATWTLTVFLQFVALHRSTPRSSAARAPLQGRGPGRPVCTETADISVEAPSSTTSGSWPPLTVSPGELWPWHVPQHFTCLNKKRPKKNTQKKPCSSLFSR